MRIWGLLETESFYVENGEVMEGAIGKVTSEMDVEECMGFGQAEGNS